jgi:hypothetical protein
MAAMWKILFAVLVLIAAALIGGVYLNFNPAIPIFVSLGVGIFLVGRLARRDGPRLPPDTHISWGAGSGVYLRGQDFVPGDQGPGGGENPREGDGFR